MTIPALTHAQPPVPTATKRHTSLLLRMLMTVAIVCAAVLLAPTNTSAPALATAVATLCAIFLFHSATRIPSHVWGPLIGAALMVSSPLWAGALFGFEVPSMSGGDIQAELVGHAGVPVLILAFAYLSISLDQSGFFNWCSLMILRSSAGSGKRLLIGLFAGVSLLTFFTSNDIVILSVTPILIYLGKNANIRNLTPLLLVQFIAANTASMGLYIGNPTNIVISNAVGIGFWDYAVRMAVPTLVSSTTALALIWVLFTRFSRNNRIQTSFQVPAGAQTAWTREMTVKAGLFAACLFALAVAGNPPVVRWLMAEFGEREAQPSTLIIVAITLVFAFAAFGYDWHLARREARITNGQQLASREARRSVRQQPSQREPRNTVRQHESQRGPRNTVRQQLARLPIEIVPFFLSFCLILRGLENAGLTRYAADAVTGAFQQGALWGGLATGFLGILTVNATNNIPATILFEKTWLGNDVVTPPILGVGERLADLHPSYPDIFIDGSLYASNFGANLTFMGALAGLIWLRLIRDTARHAPGHTVPTVGEFLKYGLLIVPVVTVATCVAIVGARIWFG